MQGPTGCFSDSLLSGKRALITGGGTGIGKAVALELARAGADLVLAARRIEVLEEAAKEISEETGRQVDCLLVNIRDVETVTALAEEVEKRWGQVDILINNAGGQFVQPAEEPTVSRPTSIEEKGNGYLALHDWLLAVQDTKRSTASLEGKRGRLV